MRKKKPLKKEKPIITPNKFLRKSYDGGHAFCTWCDNRIHGNEQDLWHPNDSQNHILQHAENEWNCWPQVQITKTNSVARSRRNDTSANKTRGTLGVVSRCKCSGDLNGLIRGLFVNILFRILKISRQTSEKADERINSMKIKSRVDMSEVVHAPCWLKMLCWLFPLRPLICAAGVGSKDAQRIFGSVKTKCSEYCQKEENKTVWWLQVLVQH